MSDRRLCGTDVAPRSTPPGSVQAALNRVGRKLTVADVKALDELDEAFRAWAEGKAGAIWWHEDMRLARAIADVIHVELVQADDA